MLYHTNAAMMAAGKMDTPSTNPAGCTFNTSNNIAMATQMSNCCDISATIIRIYCLCWKIPLPACIANSKSAMTKSAAAHKPAELLGEEQRPEQTSRQPQPDHGTQHRTHEKRLVHVFLQLIPVTHHCSICLFVILLVISFRFSGIFWLFSRRRRRRKRLTH